MTEHKITIEAYDGTQWNVLDTFQTTNRYSLTRDQRKELNRLKYECDLAHVEYRIVKERRLLK